MRLRCGKKYKSQKYTPGPAIVYSETTNITKQTDSNYRPPRKCAIASLLKTCQVLIEQETPENQFHERSWDDIDKILDEVTLDANAIDISTENVRGQITRLSTCINLLNDLRQRTCVCLRRIEKRRLRIATTHKKIAQFHNYCRTTPDNKYKEFQEETKFFTMAMSKIFSLNKTETEIAAKYCRITKCTFQLVDRAVQAMRRQADRQRYDKAPQEGSTEFERRSKVISAALKDAGTDLDHCSVCLAENIKNEPISQLNVCKHKFHTECLKKWLVIKMRCPTCRAFIDKDYNATQNSTSSTMETS